MRKLIKPLGIAGIATAISLSAQAAEETFQASVEVLQPISITETTALSFGKIIAPNNGMPNTYPSSVAFPVTGGGNGSQISGGQNGEVTADGTDGETATVDAVAVANGCTDNANLSLAITSDPTVSGTLDITHTVEAELTVQSGTPADSYTCDYTVTANYQ